MTHPRRFHWLVMVGLVLAGPGLAADHPPRRATGVFSHVDEARAAAAGLRKIPGRRLTLWTDVPAAAEIDILPQVFEQAFPQWCEFFGCRPESLPEWRMTGFLIRDRARFAQAGLLAPSGPDFRNGYSQNDGLWFYDQASDYYRRHLMLHEGTHGFMNLLLAVVPPPWYQEGIAELLATHRWRDGRLEMSYLPATREELPLWGRVRIVQDAVAEHRAKHLADVLAYGGVSHGNNEPYGWCWTAAAMLERDPRYHDRFRKLAHALAEGDWDTLFSQLFETDRREMSEQWQVTVVDLDYGYDFVRASIAFAPGKPLPAEGAEVTIAADRGWQSSRVELQGGKTYWLEAAGRYQVASQPKPWWCEPGGVSIRYYKGRPLGILLGAVRPNEPPPGISSAFVRPEVIGLGTTLTPAAAAGTLYLKINESPSQLADNAGQLRVRVHGAAVER